MACGLPEGVSIEVPEHDIEVVAQEMDIRKQRRNYTVVNATLPREAGRLLSRYTSEGALAFINIAGERAYRVYLPAYSIEFTQDIHKENIAEVQLLDARKVLRRGSVEVAFTDKNLQQIAEYLFEQRDDPFDVLTGLEFATPDSFDEPDSGSVLSAIIEQIQIQREIFTQADPIASKTGANISIQFNDVSPLEAMDRLVTEFSLDWWVERDGTLKIGIDTSRASQVVTSVAGNNNVALSRYSVTRAAEPVSSVHIRSSQLVRPDDVALEAEPITLVGQAESENIYGSLVSIESDRNYETPSQIETAAARELLTAITEDIYGSIEINGMASTEKQSIAQLDVGDLIYIDDSIETTCNKDVTTGVFIINSLQHRIGERRGWRIEVEVARYPAAGSIKTRSVWYDPEEDKQYETLRAYRQDNQGDTTLLP